MIISKTPLRVSFLGGGSDYPEYFRDNTGFTFGAAVNLYVYTTALKHSALAEAKFKLTYRQNESVNHFSEFNHPLVREILKHLDWIDGGLHISTMADVPARTGLGSSSAFAVGLINAISALQGTELDRRKLADAAIKIEREILGEPGGWQDQIYSTLGGIRLVKYNRNQWEINSSFIDDSFRELLNDSMILVNVGGSRNSAVPAAVTQMAATTFEKQNHFKNLADLAKSTFESMCAKQSDSTKIEILASAINEAWEYKSQISDSSSQEVEETIKWGLQHGAIAAKLCGAGESGFILFIIDGSERAKFRDQFNQNRIQDIKVVNTGAEIVYFDDSMSKI